MRNHIVFFILSCLLVGSLASKAYSGVQAPQDRLPRRSNSDLSAAITSTTSNLIAPKISNLAGGYQLIADISTNAEALAAVEFVRSALPTLSNSILFQASYQVVAGLNYQFIFKFEYLPNIFLQYFVQIFRSLDGKYQITHSQYYNSAVPKAEEFVKGNLKNQNKYLKKINDQVTFQLKNIFAAGSSAQVSSFQYCAPYYVIVYKIGESGLLRVDLVFDSVTDIVTILSTKRSQGYSQQPYQQTYQQFNQQTSQQGSTSKIIKTSSSTSSSTISTTTIKSEKFKVPITFTTTLLSKYSLDSSSITYSNIVPYSAEIFSQYSRIQQVPANYRSLAQQIGESVRLQLKEFDSQSTVNELKVKRVQDKFHIGIVCMVRGQKSMQNIIVTIPAILDARRGPIEAPILRQTKPKVQQIIQPKKLVVHELQPQRGPTFTISQITNNLISSVSGVSDPALIPFLTSSYADIDSKQIENVANFIINKAKITGDFTILLINQIKYGIRLVIQMNDDHKLFEAVVTSDNKQPELLLWHRISKISDVNPDCFNQYHRINPDEDLKTLIIQVFSTTEALKKLKQIIHAEKKITFDGVYYRFTVESNSGNKFLIVFYYIPEKNYNEIVRYELINNDYDATREVKLNTALTGIRQLEASKKYLFENYAGVLKDSTLSYLSSCDGKAGKYYRFVFSGIKGKYEAIILNNLEDQSTTIARWQKLEDGYIPVEISRLENNDEFRSIRSKINQYIQNKFNFQVSPSYLSVKSIPTTSSFYKFLFSKPFPFVLAVEERTSDHNLFIRGLQRIQIAPSSQYYNDRLFAGYSVYSVDELQYDPIYQQFTNFLQKQTKVKLRDIDYQVKAAFRRNTPSGIFFKIIYSAGKDYVASFSYDFAEKTYKLFDHQPFVRQVEPGDYRWKCVSVNEKTNTCNACDETAILTSGRCYQKQDSCLLQLASNCYTCQPGFIRASHSCFNSPAETQPKLAPVSAVEQTIVTVSGSRTITYINGNDQNCIQIQDSVCVKCSYRYYVNNGICKRIQDQCDVFSNQGQCYKCYSGFYLSKGVCIKLQPTCSEANSDGYCTKCYKNYVNIEGKCYIKSNLNLSSKSEAPTDQLCIRWDDGRCVQCQFGCYFSRRLGQCAIKDPFCQDWSNEAEDCQICQRGYIKKQGKCRRNI